MIATDLDGTLIPLPDHPENVEALETIKTHLSGNETPFVFATGRHFESVLEAVDQHALPVPEWIVCDVGSSIYRRRNDAFEPYAPFAEHPAALTEGVDREAVDTLLKSIEGLRPQPDAHQQRFKISYEAGAEAVDAIVKTIDRAIARETLPYSAMGSVDPFAGIGLIDVLPKNVSKAYALIWLSTHADFLPDEVIYSGDSGNDLAALVCGFRATVVANASQGLAEQVRTSLEARGLGDRLVHTQGAATSGVLEGCRHFGLL
ncbi:MAG: HAD-IIB family hydrolase [Verrucomicrobiota bacterium]